MTSHPPAMNKVEALAARGSHPGFLSLWTVPGGYRLCMKNVRLWQEEERPEQWFLEPLPDGQTGWSEKIFGLGETQDIFYRGAMMFVYLNDENWVERREAPQAVTFSNGRERSIMDLGHYIGGLRDDGAIVFQCSVEDCLV
jgi:hypothetical protein